jgi:hypothetical protein
MRALPKVLKIIFEVQRKMNNEKITRREIKLPIYKTRFFFLWTPLTFKPHNVFFIIHLKSFRVL